MPKTITKFLVKKPLIALGQKRYLSVH